MSIIITDATSRSDAYSKAMLLRDLMRAAARARCSPGAQATLAIMIAEAWPSQNRAQWHVRIARATLGNRLDRSEDSVKAWIRELREVGIIDRWTQSINKGVATFHLTSNPALVRSRLMPDGESGRVSLSSDQGGTGSPPVGEPAHPPGGNRLTPIALSTGRPL